MTEFERHVEPRRPEPAGEERREQTTPGLRQLGIALLPLAAFVAVALGYDQVVQARRPAPAAVAARAGPPLVEVADAGKKSDSAPAPGVGLPRTATRPPAQTVMPTLEDQRSLLDLSRSAQDHASYMTTQAPVVAEFAPTGTPPAVEPVRRTIEFSLDSPKPVPLGFKLDAARAPGAYAVVQGVPQNATLSHGIAVGKENWLVDGGEIEQLELSMRSGIAGQLPLMLTLMSQDSRVLAQETILVRIMSSIVALPPPVAAARPAAAPPSGELRPDVVLTARAAREVAQVQSSRLRLAIESNAKLVAGGRNRLRYQIEPSADIPDGAYVILRGLPQESTMSRGVSIGPDVWLLTLAELAEAEVRLPASNVSSLTLGAKLVTVDGQLLAEERVRFDQVPLMRVPEEPVRTEASSAAPQAVTAAPPAPVMTRAATSPPVVATPIAALSASGARTTAPEAVLPVIAKPTDTVPAGLARARRMLELGIIAAARPFLERAAGEGSAEAAAILGATYDAGWLSKAGALGIASDPERSQHWYMMARRLGRPDIERLTTLPAPGAASRPQR